MPKAEKTCPECGAHIPESSLTHGLCPKCLFLLGLDGDPEKRREIGPYEILGELGRGGMGVVYRAFERSTNRVVALKVLPEEMSRKPELIKRFQREAQAAAALHHPNIVPVYAIGEDFGTYYFAMEYVEGMHLAQYAKEFNLRPRQVVNIISEAVEALCAAHQAGILHRDIKPHNMMIDQAGHVRVMDFGLAKQLETDVSSLTVEGAFLGTVRYASPEQCGGESIDTRSDLYAIGVVMFELLAGQLPYSSHASMRMIRQKILGQALPLETLRPSLAPELTAIVNRLLSLRPEERFDSAQDLRQALSALKGIALQTDDSAVSSGSGFLPLIHRGASRSTGRAVVPVSQQASRRSRWIVTLWAIVGIAVFCAVGMRAYMWHSHINREKKRIQEDDYESEVFAVTLSSKGDPRHGDEMKVDIGNGEIIEFVYIEGDTYMMGSGNSNIYDAPPHRVKLSGFWMSKYEITINQFRQFLFDTGSISSLDFGDEHSPIKNERMYPLSGSLLGQSGDQPMVEVAWAGASEFCSWLSSKSGQSFRLPTEAEWEYACRAGTKTKHFAGDSYEEIEGYANLFDLTAQEEMHARVSTIPWEDHFAYSAPVGSFSANPWGLYDMIGNVSEWCADWYDYDYYKNSPSKDPKGPATGFKKVIRGGSWNSTNSAVACYLRDSRVISTSGEAVGFRIVGHIVENPTVGIPGNESQEPMPPSPEAKREYHALLARSNETQDTEDETRSLANDWARFLVDYGVAGWRFNEAREKEALYRSRLSGPKHKDIHLFYLEDNIILPMVYVQGGSFIMGSSKQEQQLFQGRWHSPEQLAAEGPRHTVELDGFWIGMYEVTNAQFLLHDTDHTTNRTGPDWKRNPVINVTWEKANQFCEYLTAQTDVEFRLPTEAEWEYACRAGNSGMYCFSQEMQTQQYNPTLNEYAWISTNAPRPVGTKKPNAWGIYDMHGNIWEWCSDWFSQDYYSVSPRKNPQGPQKGSYHVLRGGSYIYGQSEARSAARPLRVPGRGGMSTTTWPTNPINIGFRVVCKSTVTAK